MGQRESKREEILSADEGKKKAGNEERKKLGSDFDPCLLINLSEPDRKRAQVRKRERESRDGSSEVFTRLLEAQIHPSSPSSYV